MAGLSYGIDLGTSTCSAASVSSIGRDKASSPTVVSLPTGWMAPTESACLPSLMVVDRGKALCGFDAEARLSNGPFPLHSGSNVFASVKSALGAHRSYPYSEHPDFRTPRKIWAAIIRDLCERIVRTRGKSCDPRDHDVVLTVPASFNALQREDTLEAAEDAGFRADAVGLIDEPVAALIDLLQSDDFDESIAPNAWTRVLVFDFGGGTCDLSLLELKYDREEALGVMVHNLAISPYEQLGGDTLDRAITHQIVAPQLFRNHGSVLDKANDYERRSLLDCCTTQISRRLKELVCEALAAPGQGPGQQPFKRAYTIPIGERMIRGEALVRADEFHEVMKPFLDSFSDGVVDIGEGHCAPTFASLIARTLQLGNVRPEQLDVIVLNGASCRNPLIRDGLQQMMGPRRWLPNCRLAATPDLATSVARGAAIHAHDAARKRTIVPPVLPEELGLVTKGNHHKPIAEAGAELPIPAYGDRQNLTGELFASHANQRRFLVPFYAGSDDKYRIVGSLTFELGESLAEGHPVDLAYHIDENKLTTWQFRPHGQAEWGQAQTLNDPWIREEMTPTRRKLYDLRQRIAACLEQGTQPTTSDLAQEALLTARVGQVRDALVLIRAVQYHRGSTPELWNIVGLIHSHDDDEEQAINAFRKAVNLAPSDPVLRANLGDTLKDASRYKDAEFELRHALSINPRMGYAHRALAEVLHALDRHEDAEAELAMWYEQALNQTTHRPDDPSAWRELGAAATRLGRYADARTAQQRAQQLQREQEFGGSPDELLADKRFVH